MSSSDSRSDVVHTSIPKHLKQPKGKASTMGVPFEALLPYGIMIAFFGVTGAGLSTIRYLSNDYKRPRRQLDLWDRQMMQRDMRLTGKFRAQSDKVEAPVGFEVSNPWKLEDRII